MIRLAQHADDLLRGRLADGSGKGAITIARLLLLLILCGLIYGAVMGAYAGQNPPRPLQMLVSGLKVPMLLVITFVISLPSFFVLNTLLGVRADFAQAVRALTAAQAGLAVILASFAPFTAVWYLSTTDYQMALLFNALMFGLASVCAQLVLRRTYRPLIERNPRHRTLLRAWLVVYAFVGIQLGYLLRPFIGHPDMPTQFFRSENTWGNAYEVVFHTLVNVLRNL